MANTRFIRASGNRGRKQLLSDVWPRLINGTLLYSNAQSATSTAGSNVISVLKTGLAVNQKIQWSPYYPDGTYITAISPTLNQITVSAPNSSATTIAGFMMFESYPGAPARVEDAAWPMSNALLPDRYANVWKHPGGAANVNITDTVYEIDLGNAYSVYLAGVLGLLRSLNFSYPQAVYLEYIPAANVYSTGAWVTVGTFPLLASASDSHSLTGLPVSARFWRFRFTFTTGAPSFAISSFALADVILDLGFLYARSDEVIVRPEVRTETYSRLPMITRLARTWKRWTLHYPNIDPTTRATFDTLFGDTTFLFLNPIDGQIYECVFDGEEFERAHIWAAPDRFEFSAGIRSLP